MSLVTYNNKRKFDQTPEPSGRLKKDKVKELEFVVQKHHASHLHYDFRLELDGVLKSWAVPKGPSLRPQDKRLAMMVEDHPYEYRKFEGTIPKGNYGAGNVIIWDRGTYRPRKDNADVAKELRYELKKGHLTFVLQGEKLKGEFALIKSPHMGENAWLLVKKDDEYAKDKDVTEDSASVISGSEVDELGGGKIDLSKMPKADMPSRVLPMLATLADESFDSDDWLYEIKWDGYRAIGSWDGKKAGLQSRNGNDFSRYKPIYESLQKLKHKVVLDGEIVSVDEQGKANFGWMQNWHKSPRGSLLYYVFDILWCDGHDLTDQPLIERKKILAQVIYGNDSIRYSDHILSRGKEFFKLASQQKLEGIMAKNCQCRYRQGLRSKQWLKIKTHMRQEAVIGGFTEPRGSRKHIGALVLGVYDDSGKLQYIGHTGGGIPTGELPALRSQLEKLEQRQSPFATKFKPNAPVHWVKPQLVCEVSFGEWTEDGHMRQPIFVGMRNDKPPKKISREKPMTIKNKVSEKKSTARLEFSHLDKVFFPKTRYTKGELIDYYTSVADIMLPYIENRPHSLLRQPNGIEGQSFFQKDMDHMPPEWVKTVPIYSESNKKDINYLVPENVEHLLYMVQLGCVEINPWNSKVNTLEKPDWCVIDLDPEDISFEQVIKVARVVHELCEELAIAHYPKTSGKTGIHIYIPLEAKYNYEQTKQFGQILATLIHQRTKDITSLERSPKKRQKKIYVDYLQNRAGQTLAAPYCVRPVPEASVSTPLHWDEVKKGLKPENFTIKTTNKRLSSLGDVWKPVIGKGVDMKAILDKLG
jgi:bifunctional non-homologous end joining protein LigD